MWKMVAKMFADAQSQITALDNVPGKDGSTLDVQQVLNAVYGLVAIVAVGFIVYGGMMYINAHGDPSKMAKAKTAIGAAIAGLIIVSLAGAITNFVFSTVQGAK